MSALRAEIKVLEDQLSLLQQREEDLSPKETNFEVSPECLTCIIEHSGLMEPSIDLSLELQSPPSFDPTTSLISKTEGVELEPGKSLRSEIQALRSQLTPLHAQQRAILRAKRREGTPVAVPWQTIPSEILSEIMQATVNPGTHLNFFLSETKVSTDRKEFRSIRSVCRLWREVAFGTPSLWTSVYVDFEHYPEEQHPRLIQSIENYFKHSGSLPLSIGFSWPNGPLPEDEGYAFGAWLEYLFRQRSRWEEVAFYSEAYWHLQIFGERLEQDIILGGGAWGTQFLLVSTGSTLMESHPSNTTSVTSGVLQKCFPSLQTLHVELSEDVIFPESRPVLLEGHSSLRKLRLEINVDPNPYFAKFGGFPNLRKLLLTFPFLNVIPLDKESPIYDFPRLELLVLSCMSSFSFLPKLRTPALRTLQIISEIPPSSGHFRPWPEITLELRNDLQSTFQDLINFMGQCDQTLTDFHLNCWFMEGDESFHRLLEVLPSVERLCIDTWFVGQPGTAGVNDVDEHRDSSQNSAYLPKVQCLCMHPLDESTDQLLQSTGLTVLPDTEITPPEHGYSPANAIVPASAAPASAFPSRGQFSWTSFGAFLRTINGRREQGEATDKAGGPSSKFSLCVPSEVLEAAGQDAQSIVKSLGSDGLKVEHQASSLCRICW